MESSNKYVNVYVQTLDNNGNPGPARPIGLWLIDTALLSPGINLEMGRDFYQIVKIFQRCNLVAGAKFQTAAPSINIIVAKCRKPDIYGI